MSLHRLALSAFTLTLALPATASSQTPGATPEAAKPNGSPFSDAHRSGPALAQKEAAFFATVGKLPKYDARKHSEDGSEPRLRLRVGGSYVGDYVKGRTASVTVMWRRVHRGSRLDPDGREVPSPVKRLPDSGASHVPVVCGREVAPGMSFLLGLDSADASGSCSILALAEPPADTAAAMRTWDEHHGFAYVHRNADAIASCETPLTGADALAAADLVAYVEIAPDGFVQTRNKSYFEATLLRTYKDTRARKTRKVRFLSYIDDSYPLLQGLQFVVFANERDGELVATRCGGTREVLVEPDGVAGEVGVGRSQITCDRVLSEDASFHASPLVTYAAVQDIVAESARTQRLRMRPIVTYKDPRPIPGDLFDLTVSPDEGVSFEVEQRVLVFAEPMRNQYAIDPCGASRALTSPPDEVAGVAGADLGAFACAPEPIGSKLVQNTSIIVAGEVTKSQTMTKQGLIDLDVSHVYAGAKHIPASREVKVYYPLGDRPFAKKQRLLLFIERFDTDRLRAVSCGSVRVLSGEPPEKLLNLARVTLTAEEPLSPSKTSPARDAPAASCSITRHRSPRPTSALFFALVVAGVTARRRRAS